MRKKIFIITIVLICIVSGIFLINKNTNIIKNMKVKTIHEIKKEKIEYSFQNSPFYKNYYSNKKLIVLNIWATWCKPCLEEMPQLNEIKSQIDNSSSIAFLSFSLDNDSIKLKKFIDSQKFDFKDVTLENYLYKNSILTSLNVNENDMNASFINVSSTEIPITYIIKSSKIVYKKVGKIDYQEFSKKINSFK